MIVRNPLWPLARCAREAGYSEAEYWHAAREIYERPGTQAALRDVRREYREKLSQRFSVDDAAEGLANIAKSGAVEFARLQAINTILEHLGVVEPKDQQRILVVVQQQTLGVILPLLVELVEPDVLAQLRGKIASALAENGGPSLLNGAMAADSRPVEVAVERADDGVFRQN
jgi:hypothetical protein